jgi:hypothetical protein
MTAIGSIGCNEFCFWGLADTISGWKISLAEDADKKVS